MKAMQLLLGVLLFFGAAAQKPANDVILKLNGEEMIGKVTEVNDDNIKFNYKDESVSYTVKKSDIIKITFASGRVEFFNKPALPSEGSNGSSNNNSSQPAKVAASPADRHNKVAILPFKFIIDKQTGDEELGFEAQQETFSLLNKHTAGLQLQDVNTTNSLLAKSGISAASLRSVTPADICAALGVEYIVQTTVTINKGALSTSSSNVGSASVKNNQGKSGNETKGVGSSSSTTTTTQAYESTVNMNVYNDGGNTLYSESRKAFFNNQNSYRDAVHYLLKRAPIYRK